MSDEKVKKYSNKDITVEWRSSLCIHTTECIKALPKVYRPMEKPWIKVENASSKELIAQIKKCPSGALSYTKNKE